MIRYIDIMKLYYIFTFFTGLCVGSFVNVLLFRLDKKSGIINGRSECQKCLKQLNWYDLIPVISFLYLRGKCRYCKSSISIIYPITEFVTASVLTLYFLVNGFYLGWSLIFLLVILILLVSLVFFDVLYLILPDKVVFTLIGVAVFYGLFLRFPELNNLLLSGFLFGLAFAILYIASKGAWMGFGDVKLVLAIGLILGYPLGFFVIIISIWTAALLGIVLIIFNRANLKTALPFGSFLSVMTIIFIIFQDVIYKKANVILQLFY
jgi:prepilin signal peptidase PulO-like enzyme (type II secretory pathway)